MLVDDAGNVLATLGILPFHQFSVSGGKSGVATWSYPNLWPGLHPSHEAPKPDHPGELVGPTRLLAGVFTPKGSDAGAMCAINGNMGNFYTFTSDGLFVATLFEDVRQGKLIAMPVAQRGMDFKGITLHDENSWPTITQTPDGKLDDWPTNWVEIDKSGAGAWFNSASRPYNVKGAVAVADGKLFAAWQAADPKLLANTGEMPTAPFKTGGTLELMIGTNPNADPKRQGPVAGDLRLLVTEVKGKTLALIYMPVDTSAKTPKVPFSSPWRTFTFDRVDDVSDKVQLAADGKGNYEISVPWEVLGLSPQPGMRIRGDIGILRGNGSSTLARIYWSNKATGIVSDVPAEAQLTPSLWGVWEFVR